MQAAIVQHRVNVDAAARRIRVRLGVENRGSATWSAEKGFSARGQIRDAETGAVIVDGTETFPVKETVPPGAPAEIEVDIDLPPITGRFHIFVSLFQEGVGWFFRPWIPVFLDRVRSRGERNPPHPPNRDHLGRSPGSPPAALGETCLLLSAVDFFATTVR